MNRTFWLYRVKKGGPRHTPDTVNPTLPADHCLTQGFVYNSLTEGLAGYKPLEKQAHRAYKDALMGWHCMDLLYAAAEA